MRQWRRMWIAAGVLVMILFMMSHERKVLAETRYIYDCQCSLSKSLYHYSGKGNTPQVTIRDTDDSGRTVTLIQNVDYRVTYERNKNYGVGRAVITGLGDYRGYHVMKFGIVPKAKVKGVKVKRLFANEATVTWKKVKGVDGFYIYRKKSGGRYRFIANITDGKYQVFHDRSKSLKKNQKYSYKIVPYVADPYYDESVDGDFYTKPYAQNPDAYYGGYVDPTSYYSSYDNMYYDWYRYSCVKGRCVSAFESDYYGTASGRVSKKTVRKHCKIYTGDAEMDYMAYLINQKIIKKHMGTQARITAIYNWMVRNCTFTKKVKNPSSLKKKKCFFAYYKAKNKRKCQAYEKKVMKQIYTGKALCIGTYWHNADRAKVAMAYRRGSCSYLTPMFNILCNAAGVEAYAVDGYYRNQDKSKSYHNWSFAKIGKKYYWFDVAVACRHKAAKNVWFKKGTKEWKLSHQWRRKAIRGYTEAAFQK